MGLIKYLIGDLIEQTAEQNLNLEFGEEDVMGVTIAKQIIPTKADVSGNDLSKFLIVHPGEFVYNPRTHGAKIGLGFNDRNVSFLISWNNTCFRVKESAKSKVIPEYLFLYFNRDEWDREACINSWGSSTEVFSWDALCGMSIYLPSYEIQEKFVAVYEAMVKNQEAYESGLEDLKLVCDGYIEELRRRYPIKKIGEYIERYDVRNGENGTDNVMGISVYKDFRIPTSKVDRNNLSNYKVVKPRQIGFVQTTHNEKVFAYAFNDTEQDIVISSVNEVFQTDEGKLIPEYLCMFFNRTEFDRYARFHSWGSARETFTWDDVCNVKIPIPDLTIQKSIADIYKVYKERQRINETLKQGIKNLSPILIKGSREEAEKEVAAI
jgi:type I restriction enzyme S subunit